MSLKIHKHFKSESHRNAATLRTNTTLSKASSGMNTSLVGPGFVLFCLVAFHEHIPVAAEDVNPQRVFIPLDAGLVNVREHGLKGDGQSDDTVPLLRLVRENLNQHKTMFFPAGTYLLSDSIPWANDKGEFWPWMTWQGEGRGRTVIRLKNRCSGFDDPARPRALLKTGCYDGERRQNAAHGCYCFDLTLNIGRGNPGAIGLDYCSNNTGAVVRVDIVSEDGAGVAGLSMTRDSPGPALIQHVSVNGFDTGIALGQLLFGMTFESIRLERQNKLGMLVNGNLAAIRRLTSVNRVPALRVEGWAAMGVLVDSHLTGGANEWSAIETSGAPTLLLRQVTTAGYQHAARVIDGDKDQTVPGGRVTEFLHGQRFSLFADPQSGRTLNLPIEDAPVFLGDANDWVSVKSLGAKGDGKADDAMSVQKAIDSGKAVVYFPQGSYRLASPVRVRGQVRRIIGFSSSFNDAEGKTLFRFENSEHPVSFERFNFFDGGKLEHATEMPVTLRYVVGPEQQGLVTIGANRVWFLEDVCTSHIRLPESTRLYARQFNCEPSPPGEGFVNDGGLIWILGLKSEFGNTIGVTRNKGRTEVLGGLMLPAQGFQDPDTPAFVVEESDFSASWNEITFGGGVYSNVVRETRAGKTRTLHPKGAGTQRAWSLYFNKN
jgi:hypothetical protein